MNFFKYSLLLAALFSLKIFAGGSCPCGASITGGSTSDANDTLALAFSPNGQCLAVGNSTEMGAAQVTIFSVNDCGETTALSPSYALIGGTSAIKIKYFSNGKCLGVLTTENLFIFPVMSDCTLGTRVDYALPGTTGRDFDISSDGSCLAVGTSDGFIRLYSVNGCTLSDPTVLDITGDGYTGINSISFSPDPNSNCLAVVGPSGNVTFPSRFATYTVTDCNTLTFIPRLISSGNINKVRFSPDGSCIYYTNSESNSISGWRVENCITQNPGDGEFTGNTPASIAISADGNCVAVANSGDPDSISFYSISNCDLTLVDTFLLEPGTNPQDIAYSPDGRFLAIAQQGTNNVRILRTNLVSPPVITSVRVGCNGCLIISGTADPSCPGFATTINLFEGANLLATVSVDASGNFFLTQLAPCFAGGQHNLSIVATNPGGCTASTNLQVAFSPNF